MQYKQKHITQTQENDQEKRFLQILTASIREMRQKTFKLAVFIGPVIKLHFKALVTKNGHPKWIRPVLGKCY